MRSWLLLALFFLAGAARADEPWVAPGPDGTPQVQLYFFLVAHLPPLHRGPSAHRGDSRTAALGQAACAGGFARKRQPAPLFRAVPANRGGTRRRAGLDLLWRNAHRLGRRRPHRRDVAPATGFLPHKAGVGCRPRAGAACRHRHRPALPRPRRSRQPVAAGPDRGPRRARRLQSLRLLRPAVPAVDDGAPEKPQPDAADRGRFRPDLGPDVLRLHGRLAQRLPGLRPPRLGHARRRPAGGPGGRRERQGFLLVPERPDALDSGIAEAGHLPPHPRHRRRRPHAGHARRYHRPRGRGELLRTALYRRLPDGVHAPADHGRSRHGRALRLPRRLQPDLRPAAGRHRRRVRRHPRRAQADRTRGAAAQADVRPDDARPRPAAAVRPRTPEPGRHRLRPDGALHWLSRSLPHA
jgi:hypothetical protein